MAALASQAFAHETSGKSAMRPTSVIEVTVANARKQTLWATILEVAVAPFAVIQLTAV